MTGLSKQAFVRSTETTRICFISGRPEQAEIQLRGLVPGSLKVGSMRLKDQKEKKENRYNSSWKSLDR